MKLVQTKVMPKPGDILGVDRGLYRHYGIYAGKNEVIHYTAPGGEKSRNAVIQQTGIADFEKSGVSFVCGIKSDSKQKPKMYSAWRTLRRAKSRIGENSYQVFSNNCEHFVLWCKTGCHFSTQSDKFIDSVSEIPLVGEGLVSLLRQKDLDMAVFSFCEPLMDSIMEALDGFSDGFVKAACAIEEKMLEIQDRLEEWSEE